VCMRVVYLSDCVVCVYKTWTSVESRAVSVLMATVSIYSVASTVFVTRVIVSPPTEPPASVSLMLYSAASHRCYAVTLHGFRRPHRTDGRTDGQA